MITWLKTQKRMLKERYARFRLNYQNFAYGVTYLRYPPTPREQELIAEFRKTISSLPEIQIPTDASPATKRWLGNCKLLREHILRRDPRSFLSWDIVSTTMVHGPREQEIASFKQLPSWEQWSRVFNAQYQISPYSPDVKNAKGNSIHHAYNMAMFDTSYPVDLSKLEVIVEYGGGYGNMCQMFYQAGFKGKYIIFDLPEFSSLQQYYLKSALPTTLVVHPSTSIPEKDAVILVSSFAELAAVVSKIQKVDLCIATWSLSESSLDMREQFLKALPLVDRYLIAYQKKFGEMDNIAYFQKLQEQLSGYAWITVPITHLEDNYYVFGKK